MRWFAVDHSRHGEDWWLPARLVRVVASDEIQNPWLIFLDPLSLLNTAMQYRPVTSRTPRASRPMTAKPRAS